MSKLAHIPAWLWWAIAGIPALGLALYAPTSSGQPASPSRVASPLPVIVSPSTEARDDVTLDLSGDGEAHRSVTLFSAVAGEVAEVGFRAGQPARTGQVLVRLVDRTQRLAADLAKARVDAAQTLVDRYESTRGTGAVPDSVADEARVALRTAQIELAQAREALADRVIRAPFDGIVGIGNLTQGDRVTTDTPLVTLDDRRIMHVDFEIPEAYLARVARGQAITAVNPAYPNRPFEGQISDIDSRVDPLSRNVRVRARVPNTDDLLRSGMSFQVMLTLAGQPRPSVPELALQFGRDGAFVWAVREDRSVQVPVRPVRRLDGRVLVEGALKTGEPVVIEGVQRLREGATVRVVGNGN